MTDNKRRTYAKCRLQVRVPPNTVAALPVDIPAVDDQVVQRHLEAVIEGILLQYYQEILKTWLKQLSNIPTPIEYALSEEYAGGYRYARKQIADMIRAESFKEASDDGIAARHTRRIKSSAPVAKPCDPRLDL